MSIRQFVDFVEIVDAPDQAALDVAPGAEVLDVQISHRQHPRGAIFGGADLGPALHPAIEGGAQKEKYVFGHGLMFALEIGGEQGEMCLASQVS